MRVISELILYNDLKNIKSAVADYADKHKISKNQTGSGNKAVYSRIKFILFQFKNIFG